MSRTWTDVKDARYHDYGQGKSYPARVETDELTSNPSLMSFTGMLVPLERSRELADP